MKSVVYFCLLLFSWGMNVFLLTLKVWEIMDISWIFVFGLFVLTAILCNKFTKQIFVDISGESH
jgi:hypothetical protein